MKQVIMVDVLMEYVVEGNLEKVLDILETVADVNKVLYNGFSMLHNAAKFGHYEMAEILVGKGHNINWRDEATGATPMHYAVQNGHYDILKMLMLNNGDISVLDEYGKSPLHYAAEKGYREIVDLLISRGHSKIVAMLLRTDSQINVQDDYGRTALHYAAQNGFSDCVDLILSNKYSNLAGKLIAKGVEIDIQDSEGNTPLYLAIKNGHLGISKNLISKGAKVELHDINGNTAFMISCDNGHVQIAKYLIELGVDILKLNKNKDSCISLSAINGHSDIVKLLGNAKSLIDNVNVDGNTPLICSVMNNHNGTTKILLDYDADIHIKNNNGDNALHIASKNSNVTVVKILLERGIDIEVKNNGGENAFLISSQNGSVEIINMLVSKMKSFDKDGPISRQSLIESSKNGYYHIVKRLLELGVNVNTKDVSGETPLHYATLNGHENVVKVLIDGGADVNSVNKFGETPMHKSAIYGKSPKIVSYLLEKGAELDVSDNSGKTPIMVAAKKTQFNVFESLLRNDPNNTKVKAAMMKATENLSPNLARMYKSSRRKMAGYIPNNKNEGSPTNTSGKNDAFSVIKNTMGLDYFKDFPEEIKNVLGKIKSVMDYRILLIFHWYALKNLSTFDEAEFYNYALRKDARLNNLNERIFIEACVRINENVYVKNSKLETGEEVFVRGQYSYDKVKQVVELFDRYFVPFIEYKFLTDKSTQLIDIPPVLGRRFSKLSSLMNIQKEERDEKRSLYEQKANKLSQNAEYIEIHKLRFVLYRYKYLQEQITGNKLEIEEHERFTKESEFLESRFRVIRKGVYPQLIHKYEDLEDKIELCKTLVNYCDYLDFLLLDEEEETIFTKNSGNKKYD